MDNIDLGALTGHSLSVAAIVGSFFGWFTPLAALAAFIWYCIQIYSSKPVQEWLHSRRLRRLARIKKEMARLEAAEMLHTRRRTPHAAE